MRPALFLVLSRAQALAAFGADRHTPTFCGGDFVKTESAVVVFATVVAASGTRLDYADQIIWSPSPDALSKPLARHSFWPSWMPGFLRRAIPAPQDAMTTLLPQAVRDCWDASREHKLFDHVVMLRHARDGDRWLYCGRAHLGSYGETTADFSLEEGRLSAEHWQALGGWTGWRVMMCGDWRDMQRDDVQDFSNRLEARLQSGKVDLFLNAWTGETFSFYFKATRAAVFYAAAMGDPWTLRIQDRRDDAVAAGPEHFFDSLGPCDTSFEGFRTIPREAAVRLAPMIFAHGSSPRPGDPVAVDAFSGQWTSW